MNTSRLVRILIGVALLASVVAPVSAQEPAPAPSGFRIEVTPGANDTPLALPTTVAVGVDDPIVKELFAVVKRDLEMTGYFTIIPEAAYVEKGGGVEPGTFSYADWALVKAVALAKTRITAQEGNLYAEVYVYDVNGQQKIVGKRFLGKASQARYLGHKLADEIIFALTGQHSFFDTRVAVVGTRTGNKEIYLMDFDGQGIQQITSNKSINLSPAWSPDGKLLGYTSFRAGNADLYVKDTKAGTTTAISAKSGVDSGAAFSPDGTRIALTRTTGSDSDIWVTDLLGKNDKRVTSAKGIDAEPSWSPDGTKLAFSSERSGGTQIYIHDFATGEATRVTFEGARNFDPAWSPDGEHIAFVGLDRNFDLFVVRTDGTGLVRLTQDQGDNEDPCWSRDGKYLMFTSTRDGSSRIWLSTADGRSQHPITPESSGWSQPAWGP